MRLLFMPGMPAFREEWTVRRAAYRMLPLFLAVFIGVVLTGCGYRSAGDERTYTPRVVVYGPCGLQGPLEAVKQLFQARHPEVRIDLMLDNSNVLVRKVTDLGEHPDVFISPGELELKQLRDRNLIDESTVRDFGSLEMAIIAPSARRDVERAERPGVDQRQAHLHGRSGIHLRGVLWRAGAPQAWALGWIAV